MFKQKLTLASQSPRRAEILKSVGWDFEAIPANIDESRFDSEEAVTYVTRLAQTKALTVASQISSGVVLGADTVVVSDTEILGQPRDEEDARRMLRMLSGKWHEVVTGVALIDAARLTEPSVAHEITRVRFAEMTAEQIDWYVSTGEPRGKAGAYAIQGKGALFIKEIQGDYFNVVGLPIRMVFELFGAL
ncbi:MAG TPA: Maf family protein [Pyrinomonadaceae bacterium]|nr:Maf family protein [Pyrinomonadaceae bacterium]